MAADIKRFLERPIAPIGLRTTYDAPPGAPIGDTGNGLARAGSLVRVGTRSLELAGMRCPGSGDRIPIGIHPDVGVGSTRIPEPGSR